MLDPAGRYAEGEGPAAGTFFFFFPPSSPDFSAPCQHAEDQSDKSFCPFSCEAARGPEEPGLGALFKSELPAKLLFTLLYFLLRPRAAQLPRCLIAH